MISPLDLIFSQCQVSNLERPLPFLKPSQSPRRRPRSTPSLACSRPRAAPSSPVAATAEQEAMLHHLRSAAATSPGRLPAPPEDAGDEDDEESVRAVAVSDQRTIYLVNMFIANTVEFLNSFAATCDDKLSLLHRKIVKLDSSLVLLEAKLHSIDENNALGHSTNQKAQESLSDDKIFCSENSVGESSRSRDS